MKNKYGVLTQEEYTNEYIKETKKQIKELLIWVKNHPKARLETCKKNFNGITNLEAYFDGYSFDMNYGNFAVSLSKWKDKVLEVTEIELWDDDYVAGSGEFQIDIEKVITHLKTEFGIEMYAI